MLDRITKNEERLDNAVLSINKLEEALNEFKTNYKNIKLLNKYYGSKSWFDDKEKYENNEIIRVKAGVLSEDAVWNMNEEIKEIAKEMKNIIKKINKSI